MRMEATRLGPQAGPQSAFLASPADICIYGGAAGGGKSYAALLEPLRHIHNPRFSAVIFRRTYPQIAAEGGLWDTSMEVYPLAGGRPRESDKEWIFPSGASVSFRHMQHETDRLAWQGAQIPLIEWDELTHFTEKQFWYLTSRSRSVCGVRPYVRATSNPDADSWVAGLISWWIGPDGYALTERSGCLRWFARIHGELVWGDTAEDITRRYPDAQPKSLTFILSTLFDNKILMEADPGYLANLEALPLVEREQLLGDRERGGNWLIRPAAGKVLNRAWFQSIPAAPLMGRAVRYWDKAGTADGGDYSAGVLMIQADTGLWCVAHVVRGQWSALQRETVILETARSDRAALGGMPYSVWVEQEPGSGGKESAQNTVIRLAGFDAHAEPVTGDKLSRARPFAAQVEAGNVLIVEGDWNRAYLDELHGFPEAKFDDQVDASSGAFNKLNLAVMEQYLVYEEDYSISPY